MHRTGFCRLDIYRSLAAAYTQLFSQCMCNSCSIRTARAVLTPYSKQHSHIVHEDRFMCFVVLAVAQSDDLWLSILCHGSRTLLLLLARRVRPQARVALWLCAKYADIVWIIRNDCVSVIIVRTEDLPGCARAQEQASGLGRMIPVLLKIWGCSQTTGTLIGSARRAQTVHNLMLMPNL